MTSNWERKNQRLYLTGLLVLPIRYNNTIRYDYMLIIFVGWFHICFLQENCPVESRRIQCTKCGHSHIWICTNRIKSKARWCQVGTFYKKRKIDINLIPFMDKLMRLEYVAGLLSISSSKRRGWVGGI